MAVTIGGTSGGTYTKKNQWKIKDGDNVYRILPSLGFDGKAPDGKPFKFYNVHFGYKNSEGKLRVFQSPEVKNRDTKMIEKEDAAKTRIESLKTALEKAKKEGNKATYDRLLPLVGGAKPLYNLDNNHHCNAINAQGEIGVLKLRHRCKLALDAVLKTLRAKGIEPLGAEQGRFFVINRTGMGLDTTFTVTVLKKVTTIDGQEFEQDVVHKLTPEIINRLEAEAGDLSNLYRRLTSEEVARVVKESELNTGKSPAIDEFFDKKNEAKTEVIAEASEDDVGDDYSENALPTPVAAKETPAPAQSLSKPPANVQVDAPVSKPAAQPVAEMNDDDFLASLG